MSSEHKDEIKSLNKEFISLNMEDLSLEELEQRLELALMTMGFVNCNDCNTFECVVNCSPVDPCTTFYCDTNMPDGCDPIGG